LVAQATATTFEKCSLIFQAAMPMETVFYLANNRQFKLPEIVKANREVTLIR